MKPSNGLARAGFTLLELVVVLAILAITTGLAVRALDRVEDQRRFESAQREFEELSEAVLGSSDDRDIDGTRTISGFVADMGRLPRTTAEGGSLTLRELWEWSHSDSLFDVRPALAEYGVAPEAVDELVLVPGGWRGPYFRLPMGAETLLDAWGNPMISPDTATPPNPDTTGYARLRDAANIPILTAGQEIRTISHLGANGRVGSADIGYDRDGTLVFTDSEFRAALTGQVEVRTGSSAATPDGSFQIVVRVFGPHPENPALILAASSDPVPFNSNPVTCTVPFSSGITMGPRIVRAYLYSSLVTGGTSASPPLKKSSVKHVTLRPGMNLLPLTIDR